MQPSTLVFGFLLCPAEFGAFVLLENLSQLPLWQWIQLFDAHNRHIAVVARFLASQNIVVDFTGAENHPTYLFAHLGVVDYLLEFALAEVFHRAYALGVTQQALGTHDHHGHLEIALQLPAHRMEQTTRGRAVQYLHVGTGAQL